MNKKIIYFALGIILLGAILVTVQAQTSNRISPRCNSDGTVNVDYAYKVHSEEGYTNYIAILEAGRCKRDFRGTVQVTSNLEQAITTDINSKIESTRLSFYPDPFGETDVDGRGSFSIP